MENNSQDMGDQLMEQMEDTGQNTSNIMMEGQGYGAVEGMDDFEVDMEGSAVGGRDSLGQNQAF